MNRTHQNLEMVSGDDKVFSLTARAADGSVQSLSGATALTFKAGASFGEGYLIQKTLGSGVTVVSAANGTLTVTLTDDDTEHLEGDLAFDVAATISGLVKTVVRGRLRIHGDIT
jgi:uncharacterized protein (AIM24 family)